MGRKSKDIKLNCPKIVSGVNCHAHNSLDKDKNFVSYMCPRIATKEQCFNSKHSPSDHGKEKLGRDISFLTTTQHKEEVEDHSADEGIVEDEEEG